MRSDISEDIFTIWKEMKAEAILGAVRGGYINTLITDEEEAKAVLALCK